MIKKFILTFIFFVIGGSLLWINNTNNEINTDNKHTIHSEILNETREYWVQLPIDYLEEKKYNVIVMTDAEYLFHSILDIVDIFECKTKSQNSILVGIKNTDRMRDLTPTNTIITSYGNVDERLANSGGSAKFLKFISDELIPDIDNKYSTSNQRSFIGHSNGGLFAGYILLEKPELFNAYIIIDPTVYWDNEYILNNQRTKDSTDYNHIKGVYVSSANNEGDPFLSEDVMKETQLNFVKTLTDKGINVKFDRFEEENHNTVPFISVRKGLEFIYN
ncbi:MAG: alpha/beta hydrolase-fold protein [Emcibacteraceae bacterium]|nr:alpha/beta hydrolase-fold protein [Emcibacteraceae bacterium]